MSASETPAIGPRGYERATEYAAILQDTAGISGRRQTMNDIFVGLNVVYLTAVGFLLSTTNFESWAPAIAVALGCAGVATVNHIWRRTIKNYSIILDIRHRYIESIEQEFREQRGEPPLPNAPKLEAGMFLMLKSARYSRDKKAKSEYDGYKLPPHGFSKLEADLERLLTSFAVGVALITLLVTFLVTQGMLAAVRL
jgi:hypothetical protein